MNSQILQWLSGRRSIRRYQSKPVPRELLELCLAAAVWAPSAHNRQPWRFAVITAAATKDRLASAMGRRLRADLTADGLSPAIVGSDVDRSYRRLTSAPVLILLALTMTDMDSYPDERRRRNEWVMAVQSTAMAGQNLMLAAHAAGLGACWMCAPLFAPETVHQALDLPNDWQPMGLITLGYPAEEKEKTRRPPADCTVFLDD